MDGPPTAKSSADRGSAPTPFPPPKDNHTKTTALSGGTRPGYPHMRPKWYKVTNLSKSDKVCCICFHAHTQAQGCVPLAHAGLVVSNDPEGSQRIIAAYVEKNKTWKESKKNAPTSPKPRGQITNSLDRPPLPPIPSNNPPTSTARPNYWDAPDWTLTTTQSSGRIFTSTVLKKPPTHQRPHMEEE